MFEAHICLQLEPVWHLDPPEIRWGIDGEQQHQVLQEPLQIDIDRSFTHGLHVLHIEFFNKTPEDALQPRDKAVIIRAVTVEGLATRQISQGTYYPIWPEHMLQSGRSALDLWHEYRHSTYLGWNGVWIFDFSSPIYTWIHQRENLGFFYQSADKYKQQ